MRIITGSAFSSAANSKTQIITVERPLITHASFKPHVGNALPVYVGASSAVSAASGWSFSSGTTDQKLEITATVKGSTYWMMAADSVSLVDYVFVMEN